MKVLIVTWPRRVAVAVAAWMITTVLMASLMAHVEQPDPTQLEFGDWMKRFVVVPSLVALMVFLFTTAMARSAHSAPTSEFAANVAPAVTEPAKPFVAQVVGLIWLNPLQRMDYPTEWQLLWTQGLARRTKTMIWFAPIQNLSRNFNRLARWYMATKAQKHSGVSIAST